ncbi:MAG: TadE/TadG family type IV pilus assembly protein [Candidatus Limnocylindria bacterium]
MLPLLLVLLLGIADFGRVFAAGITIEAAARNAAEVGAIERLRNKPPDPFLEPVEHQAYYETLHELIAKTACSESRLLPNATFVDDDDATTPLIDESRTCPQMPVIGVCVRDDLDPLCGAAIDGFASPPPPECGQLGTGWTNVSGGAEASHSVEVRICYHFTTLFNLHLALPLQNGINLGDVWLYRSRVFVLDCPPGDVSTC